MCLQSWAKNLFQSPVLGHGEFSWQSKAKDIVVEELVSHGFPALVRSWISLSKCGKMINNHQIVLIAPCASFFQDEGSLATPSLNGWVVMIGFSGACVFLVGFLSFSTHTGFTLLDPLLHVHVGPVEPVSGRDRSSFANS